MTRPRKPEVTPPPDDSDEMRRFSAVVNGVWGWHHLKSQKWHRPDTCEVWLFGSLSTFDFNELTRLVVLARDYRDVAVGEFRDRLEEMVLDVRKRAQVESQAAPVPVPECLRRLTDEELAQVTPLDASAVEAALARGLAEERAVVARLENVPRQGSLF